MDQKKISRHIRKKISKKYTYNLGINITSVVSVGITEEQRSVKRLVKSYAIIAKKEPIFFARNSNWGYITPVFEEGKRPLNHMSHRKFVQGRKEFLKEFYQL